MALAVIRELGQEFPGREIISVSLAGRRALGHKSRYTTGSITVDEENYAAKLLELAAGPGSNILVPAGMHSLNIAARHHREFSAVFSGLWPQKAALDKAADKPIVAATAKALGLLTPREYPLEAPVFPCVLKYRNGEALGLPAHKRYAIATNLEEYERGLQVMNKQVSHMPAERSTEIFATQYIAGDAYGVSAVLDTNSEPLAVFAHKRIREYPLSGGPATCAESIWHLPLIQAGVSLLKELGLVGLAMAEFKGSLNAPYILEVNPRIWGTYPLARLAGAGMMRAYVEGDAYEIPKACPYVCGLRMQFLANDLQHFAKSAAGGRFPMGVLRDMLSPKVRGGVFDKSDLAGSFGYLRNLVKL